MLRDALSVMRVDVGEVSVAIDARTVREVLGTIEITRMPGPRGLVGIMPWDGRALAVLDLGAFLGVDSDVARPRTLIVAVEGATVAVPIDRAYEPTENPDTRHAHALRIAFADMEVDIDGATMPVFDVAAVLASLDGVRS